MNEPKPKYRIIKIICKNVYRVQKRRDSDNSLWVIGPDFETVEAAEMYIEKNRNPPPYAEVIKDYEY